MSISKNKIFWVIILLALGGALGSRWQAGYDAKYYKNLTKNARPVSSEKIRILIDDGQKAPFILGPFEFVQDQNLFDLTEKGTKERSLKFDFKDFGQMGYLVTQIGDQLNGTDNKYWQFWINNEQVQVAANKYLIKPGDIVLWKFSKSEF